jgi:hypothetical protein
MANFNSMVLTEKGQVLYAKGQAGKTINFTKMAVGIGDIGSTDPTTLTDLVNRKFDIAIQSKTVNTMQKVALISGTLTNDDMTESVYLQEIGLYAMDPDDGEILYSYASAGIYGDYTSPASNGPYAWNYQVYAAIGNAANVTVTLSNLQYDTGIINTNTTFSIIKGGNQKEINKSIDNKLKPYLTTNSENVYSITNTDIDALTDGYPILVRFNADSTGNISLKVNNSTAYDVVDYFNNNVSNVRDGLIAHLIFDATNENFQLLGKGGEGDATPDQVLINHKFTNNSGVHVGAMPENGDLNANLDAGQSFNIPAGHTTGGTVKANSLASHTQATADSSKIVDGYDAWVDGNLIHGQATIESLGGRRYASGTSSNGSISFYVNIGFKPSIVITITNDVGNLKNIISPVYNSSSGSAADTFPYFDSTNAPNGFMIYPGNSRSINWQAWE